MTKSVAFVAFVFTYPPPEFSVEMFRWMNGSVMNFVASGRLMPMPRCPCTMLSTIFGCTTSPEMRIPSPVPLLRIGQSEILQADHER
ncbi:hypothetical protein GS532_22715 [Rhodococcus hoagii]|nr:hypothetical protein [Prescottella equi]